MTDGAISDVDASTLLRAMPERDQAVVRDAWRDAEPASTDGVTAAVAVNRIAKQRRFLWLQVVGWGAFAVLSVAALERDSISRMVAAGLPSVAIAAWAWFALVRSRRNLKHLEQVADPNAAAERARLLRASSSASSRGGPRRA